MSDEQKLIILGILSKYDADNLIGEDTQAIFEEMYQASIQPEPGMKEVIEDAGSDYEHFK